MRRETPKCDRWAVCTRLCFSFGSDFLINKWGRENISGWNWKLRFSSPLPGAPPPQNHHPRCVCPAVVCMSNAALSFHLGAEFRKNQAGGGDPHPSINLREGRGRQRRSAVMAKGFSVTLPPSPNSKHYPS